MRVICQALAWLSLCYPWTAFADMYSQSVNPNSVTGRVLVFSGAVNSFVTGACLMLGMGLVVAAFYQYTQHKRNPVQVSVSKPIFFLILGLILVALALLGKYTTGGNVLNRY
jgi:hypothetical protein